MKHSLILIGLSACLAACNESSNTVQIGGLDEASVQENTLGSSSKEDASYWYGNKAEITSYHLTQARYGELHEGTATFVFVTETFSPSQNTKADRKYDDNVPVLKLNRTRKFNTGIYPYSVMSSTFFPFKKGDHSLKVTNSSQEWCGHTFMELGRSGKQFNVELNSYFEGEGYDERKTEMALLEDDVWSMIRLRNSNLPEGKFKMYPSMEFCRFLHVEFRPYSCEAIILPGDNYNTYVLKYPEIDRELSITYLAGGNFEISQWTETYFSGYGSSRKKLTTKGEKMESINIDYWNKNKRADSTFRKQLNLL
ncbi:MAG: hypothetical protein ACJASQ_000027 [Crocinitomicaceae bacterium]|jgi:hypothetical protein